MPVVEPLGGMHSCRFQWLIIEASICLRTAYLWTSIFGWGIGEVKGGRFHSIGKQPVGALMSWISIPRISWEQVFESCLFRNLPLRHILNRADIFQSPVIVANPVRDQVQVFDRIIRH